MANFRPMIVYFLLLGVFMVALINGGILLATQHSANQSIGDDSMLTDYRDSLNNTLAESYNDAQEIEGAMNKSEVTLTTGIPVINAITGVWKTIKVVPMTIYNLASGLVFSRILGSYTFAIILSVISAIVIITILFAVWKFVSTGDAG